MDNRSAIAVQMDTGSDISSFIGLTLDELFSRFGSPQSVYAVRGLEAWQDDVVFIYNDRDFYVYKNRVWQVGVKAGYGVKIGDSLSVVTQILGNGSYFEGYLLAPLPSRAWPLTLRVNFDKNQSVSAIFIYRSDF
ncbi:MAG: hypothetical protein LBG73_00055 [Spirochaetaceae bacterium]|nr:hypothetical protein [Spirochaetaceae bacterium]